LIQIQALQGELDRANGEISAATTDARTKGVKATNLEREIMAEQKRLEEVNTNRIASLLQNWYNMTSFVIVLKKAAAFIIVRISFSNFLLTGDHDVERSGKEHCAEGDHYFRIRRATRSCAGIFQDADRFAQRNRV